MNLNSIKSKLVEIEDQFNKSNLKKDLQTLKEKATTENITARLEQSSLKKEFLFLKDNLNREALKAHLGKLEDKIEQSGFKDEFQTIKKNLSKEQIKAQFQNVETKIEKSAFKDEFKTIKKHLNKEQLKSHFQTVETAIGKSEYKNQYQAVKKSYFQNKKIYLSGLVLALLVFTGTLFPWNTNSSVGYKNTENEELGYNPSESKTLLKSIDNTTHTPGVDGFTVTHW